MRKEKEFSETAKESANKSTPSKRSNKKRSGRFKPTKDKRSYEKVTSTNDPAWYSNSPELLRDSASIPFSWPVGTYMNTNANTTSDVVPGICALDISTGVGYAHDMNSPINVAASAIYSWVRHANSGHANYEAPDLMMYLLAMSNMYSFIVWAQRIYGYVSLYDQRNRYLPRGLCWAEGVNFASIRDNLANYRYALNLLINKVASLAVPSNMDIFKRIAFLYSNVYCEGPSIKDQMYLFTPRGKGFWKFQINESTSVGELIVANVPTTDGDSTWEQIITFGNDLFNAIWDQEDFGIMSGDIIKAYGTENLIKLSPVPEEMNFVPIYDALVLHQFKNAKVMGYFTQSRISQNNGIITYQVTMNAGVSAAKQAEMFNYLKSNKILSTDYDSPGPDVVIESTRLMCAYDDYRGIFYPGVEFVSGLGIINFDNSGNLHYQNLGRPTAESDCVWHFKMSMSATDFAKRLMKMAYTSSFKYMPEILMVCIDDDNHVVADSGYRYWDIDNYAVLSNHDLIKMHDAALMSLFAVPAIAKIS